MLGKFYKRSSYLLFKSGSIFNSKKASNATFTLSKYLTIFSTFTLGASVLWFRNDLEATEKLKEIKSDIHGFKTEINKEWSVITKQNGQAQETSLFQENSKETDNKLQIISSEVLDAEFTFESYVSICIEMLKQMNGLDNTKEMKNFQNETKMNKFGHQYEIINYLISHKKTEIVEKYQIVIFFRECDNIGVIIQNANELLNFQENLTQDIVGNMDFFKKKF
eukprot:gene12827-7178_t